MARNKPTVVNNVSYSGHALDQMQNRGVTPSMVESTIKNGSPFQTNPGTVGFFDSVNNIRVIMNAEKSTIITVIRGAP